jgi:hypothetical protein
MGETEVKVWLIFLGIILVLAAIWAVKVAFTTWIVGMVW